uniref:ATP-dependent DNA helicase n=1 Tax=Ananas comosus var. bracteatus TaxID=296719 RepID=A0A6V7QRN9_ANACO
MSLKQRGIKADYLGSTQTNRSVSTDAEKGSLDILYMTPEKAYSLPPSFWTNLLNAGICLLAVDEAHCISEWGHNFRKEYKQLHVLRDVLVNIPFVALTATATEKVQSDIIGSLMMRDPYIVIGSFDRQNLFYGVKSCNRTTSFLEELVTEVSNYNANKSSTIIYCTTVKDTEQICDLLTNAGIRTGIYHGQMGSKAREESHRSFIRDEIHVMVATIAFGMGIDKPDVRCVIHYGCPKSLESYYQESGRCGRDGLPSICWLYYSRSDFAKADFYCSEAQNETQRKAIMQSFMAAQKYCFLPTCRRKFILGYFGEKSISDCGNCDNCKGTRKEKDLSRESVLLLSCIKSCGGRWGLNMPIDVLRGSRSRKILDNNYEELPLHGLGKDHPANWWKALGDLLIANDFLKENLRNEYRSVSVSLKGLQFLSTANTVHETPLVLAITPEMIEEEEQGSLQRRVGDLQSLSFLDNQEFSEAEGKLYRMLLDIRMKLAKDNGTAPYAICGDQTIKMMTKRRPSTRANLAKVDGVNQHLVTKYGDSFLENIRRLSQELNLPLDNGALVWPTVQKGACTNTRGKTSPARFEAWKAWEKDGLSFQEIANFPTRPAPIKVQTVISYILEAARDGCELKRLKLIKEELPENVSYEHIRTLLTVEELGIKVEELFAGKTADEAPVQVRESPASVHDAEVKEERGSCEECITGKDAIEPSESIDKRAFVRQHRSVDGRDVEDSPKKLQKISEQKGKCGGTFEATGNSLLEWIGDHHDGVSLAEIAERFSGSERDIVANLLDVLEGEFLIFRKNDLYRAM